MTKSHKVTIAVTQYIESIIEGDQESILSMDATKLAPTELIKLTDPFLYNRPDNTEIKIINITPIIPETEKQEYDSGCFAFCTHDLEQEIFNHV